MRHVASLRFTFHTVNCRFCECASSYARAFVRGLPCGHEDSAKVAADPTPTQGQTGHAQACPACVFDHDNVHSGSDCPSKGNGRAGRISVGKRLGSKSMGRWRRNSDATTIKDALQAGGTPSDMRNDFEKGLMVIENF